MSRNTIIGLIIALIVIAGLALVYANSRNNANDMQSDTTGATNTLPVSTVTPVTDSTASSVAESSPATTTPAADSVTVTYDGDAYSPATVTVKLGQTVTFVNKSDKNMWVGSDPHPLHTNYGEFDTKKGIAPGESWSYTFGKVGSHNYHDHLTPRAKGTVIVQE